MRVEFARHAGEADTAGKPQLARLAQATVRPRDFQDHVNRADFLGGSADLGIQGRINRQRPRKLPRPEPDEQDRGDSQRNPAQPRSAAELTKCLYHPRGRPCRLHRRVPSKVLRPEVDAFARRLVRR